jgi:hypothetical protein
MSFLSGRKLKELKTEAQIYTFIQNMDFYPDMIASGHEMRLLSGATNQAHDVQAEFKCEHGRMFDRRNLGSFKNVDWNCLCNKYD